MRNNTLQYKNTIKSLNNENIMKIKSTENYKKIISYDILLPNMLSDINFEKQFIEKIVTNNNETDKYNSVSTTYEKRNLIIPIIVTIIYARK